MSRPKRCWRALAALAWALGGCGGEGEPLSQTEVPKAGDPPPDVPVRPDAGVDPGPPDAGGPPKILRTVETRNPFGDEIGNLLADGDFELSISPYPGQYGWRAFEGLTSETALVTETGGLCKSGLRCAAVTSSVVLLAQGASIAESGTNVASLWFKPNAASTCDSLDAIIVDCDRFSGDVPINATGVVDDRGWCEYAGEVPARRSGVCLWVETTSVVGGGLIDAAAIRKKEPATVEKQAAPVKPAPAWAPPPELAERMRKVGEVVRRTRRFGKPPSAPAAPIKN